MTEAATTDPEEISIGTEHSYMKRHDDDVWTIAQQITGLNTPVTITLNGVFNDVRIPQSEVRLERVNAGDLQRMAKADIDRRRKLKKKRGHRRIA